MLTCTLVLSLRFPLWLVASRFEGSARASIITSILYFQEVAAGLKGLPVITSILYFQKVAGGPTMDTSFTLHTHYELSTSNSPETSDYQMHVAI